MTFLQSNGLSRVFSNTTVLKHQFLDAQLSLWPNSHIHNDYWETTALIRQTFVDKVTSLLFNMLSRLVIAFLPRSKHLFISWMSPKTIQNLQLGTVLPFRETRSSSIHENSGTSPPNQEMFTMHWSSRPMEGST